MSVHRPGVSIIPLGDKTPRIADSAFIAPGCSIIGDVGPSDPKTAPIARVWVM